MRAIAIIVAAAATGLATADFGSAVITQWDFNGTSTGSVPGGGTSPTPWFGAGTAALVGGTTGSFASGTADGGSSDPVNTTPTNYGWNITTFAAQGTGNNTRGVQFNVSTVGYEKISVSWDQRNSNTGSRYGRFFYSLNGVDFTTAGLANDGLYDINAGVTWFNGLNASLGSIAGVADNANFAFRLVATFAPSDLAPPSVYVPSNASSSYGPAGTWRLDMVSVIGNQIPTPGALALLGVAGLISRRRR